MKTVNVAQLKDHLSQFLRLVEGGEALEICKRNVPFARLVPLPRTRRNKTQLGCDLKSVAVKADLTEPAMPDADWDMLRSDP